MAELNALAPALGVVLGALLTYLAVIHSQHLTTTREREARESDRQAKMLQRRNEFQARTLISSQRLAMQLVQRTVFFESAKFPEKAGVQISGRAEKIQQTAVEVWVLINKLSHTRERLHDADLRAKLESLGQRAGWYLADAAESRTLTTTISDLETRFNEVNGLLGSRLRELI